MPKKSPVAIFLAASTLLATNTMQPSQSFAGVANDSDSKMGGLKEWTTDQDINEESKLDEDAKKAKKKAKKEKKKAAKKSAKSKKKSTKKAKK